ncbi:MAG: hypothetical protein QNJ60_06795 [Xenococcaceae cyanobacterium MO_188.B19]|nr:hypothetical protein [Xenococcaceae cyanobacterium MO_188.B19]
MRTLANNHKGENFSCGNEQLDRYFKLTASQNLKRNIAVPYIAINLENFQIIGYYTLSMTSVDYNLKR